MLDKLNHLDGVVRIDQSERHLYVECKKGYDLRERVAEICVQSGIGLLGLMEEKLSLEDAFVKLITKDISAETTKELTTV